MQENIMKYDTVLPRDFDGIFRFTNWSNEDFVGIWEVRNIPFPKETTSPMVIPEHSPLEIQQIRKKFAKDLAQREFFKSVEYKKLSGQERNNDGTARLNSFQMAGQYDLEQLAPMIQKCLEPLPISNAIVTELEKEPMESRLTRNEEGRLNTEAIDRKTSLMQKALNS